MVFGGGAASAGQGTTPAPPCCAAAAAAPLLPQPAFSPTLALRTPGGCNSRVSLPRRPTAGTRLPGSSPPKRCHFPPPQSLPAAQPWPGTPGTNQTLERSLALTPPSRLYILDSPAGPPSDPFADAINVNPSATSSTLLLPCFTPTAPFFAAADPGPCAPPTTLPAAQLCCLSVPPAPGVSGGAASGRAVTWESTRLGLALNNVAHTGQAFFFCRTSRGHLPADAKFLDYHSAALLQTAFSHMGFEAVL